ncbi:MAG: carboxypeptidase-like regulatory domain-containing protein, partial [Raineya sp.]|nr:carboxypeptidase-like regulatory domain-containing protein [Raineya sp.]
MNIFSFWLLCAKNLAQVQGVVCDKQTRTPIEGVRVFVKRSGIFTTTNKDGYFYFATSPDVGDTVFFSKINFENKYILFNANFTKDTIFLENYELIEKIEVKPTRFYHRQKIGDLRTPFKGVLGLGANTNMFVQTRNPIVSYIPNKNGKKGEIHKVFIKFSTNKLEFLEKSLINHQVSKKKLKNPDYIK